MELDQNRGWSQLLVKRSINHLNRVKIKTILLKSNIFFKVFKDSEVSATKSAWGKIGNAYCTMISSSFSSVLKNRILFLRQAPAGRRSHHFCPGKTAYPFLGNVVILPHVIAAAP